MRRRKGPPDFLLFLTAMLLLCIGLIMVFSSSSYFAMIEYKDHYYFLKRQLLWALFGLFALFFTMQVDYLQLRRYAKLFFAGSLIVLAMVPLFGVSSHGATRALNLGPVPFQPSELIKLTMVMFLAKKIEEKRDGIGSFWQGVLPLVTVLVLVAGLIMLQPDMGTTLTVAGTFFLVLFASGAKLIHLSWLGLGGMAGAAVLAVSESYRLKRLLAFMNPEADPRGSGFQTIQSLLALGSGGLFGMGLGQGRQKLLYVPERHTDFIFSILGEELGFIGVTLVILLFCILVWRGLRIAITTADTFGSLLATGLTSTIAIQTIINIGVVSGSLPITGITLPLISYGGSSLFFTLMGIGILLNISRYASQR